MGSTCAVFGGSFNPPHVAHALVCLYVLETQHVDELYVVPCWRHPFEKQLAPYADRVAMCHLLVAPLGPRVSVSTIEEELGGESSRTLVTLEHLAAKEPDKRWRLVIGSDILRETAKWWRWADVEKLAPPIVVGRAGYPSPDPDAVVLPDVSSTEVRARLARGANVDTFLTRSVRAYVAQRGLYQ